MTSLEKFKCIGDVKNCIYRIVNPSGKSYIGKTINFTKRFSFYNKYFHKGQPKLYNSFFKHGISNHTFEILEQNIHCLDLLNTLEIFYISKYQTQKFGLNCTIGGDGKKGMKTSEATKIKMSEARKGCKHNEETKKKIGDSNKKRSPSKETREKISKTLKGRDSNRKGVLKKHLIEALNEFGLLEEIVPRQFKSYHIISDWHKMCNSLYKQFKTNKIEIEEFYKEKIELSKKTRKDINLLKK